jgi:hypothetical protein
MSNTKQTMRRNRIGITRPLLPQSRSNHCKKIGKSWGEGLAGDKSDNHHIIDSRRANTNIT